MQIETVPIRTLQADPANARKHTRQNLRAIERSLERFGQQKPIVVNQLGQVIAGHGTLAAAVALGWESIAIVRSDLLAHEAMAYAIADNRTAELAQWNNDILAQQLATLQIDPASPHEACGFDERQMQKVIDHAAGLDHSPPEHQPVVFQVLVTCRSEDQQRRVYESLTDEGLPCRVLTL